MPHPPHAIPPVLCVIVPWTEHSAPQPRALESLAALRFPNWSCLLVTPCEASRRSAEHIAQSDPRIQVLPSPPEHWLDAALSRTRAEWVTWVDPRDQFVPAGLEAALSHAARDDAPALLAGFEVHAPLGVIPRASWTPARGTPPRPPHQAGITCPPHAHLTRRALLSEAMHTARRAGLLSTICDITHPARDSAMLHALGASGLRCTPHDRLLARVNLRPPVSPEELCDLIASHAAARSVGVPEIRADSPAHHDPLAHAFAVQSLHARAVRELGASVFKDLTRFPALFAQWWARCGFFGPAPAHVRESEGGPERQVSEIPALAAIELLDHAAQLSAQPPVLYGLGQNARVIARLMHERALPIRGVDDALTTSPAWAAKDALRVELLPSSALGRADVCIVTPWNDADILPRLPAAVRAVRWADVAHIATQRAISELRRRVHDLLGNRRTLPEKPLAHPLQQPHPHALAPAAR